jgi:perosamine synthetase
MLVTNNRVLFEKARLLRNHGMTEKKRYWHTVVGYNYRMTNIQAAIGVAQMEHADGIISDKRKVAALYNRYLRGIEGITLPCEEIWAKNVYWMYSILVERAYGLSAGRLREKLAAKGVETRAFFYPVSSQPQYLTGRQCPVSREVSRKGINLPSSPRLKESEIKYIAGVIKNHG